MPLGIVRQATAIFVDEQFQRLVQCGAAFQRADGLVERIQRALRDQEYAKRLPAILEARRLILNEYALFPLVARLIEQRHQLRGDQPLSPHSIFSRRAVRRKQPISAIRDAVDKSILRLRHRFS